MIGEWYRFSFCSIWRYANFASDDRIVIVAMKHAADAGFDASNIRTHCHEGTRVLILHQLMIWVYQQDTRRVYWLNGHAGSGKSTIAQSFAEMLFVEHLLGASVFCSRDSSEKSDIKMIFPTIAF